MFPYIPETPDLRIDKIALLFEASSSEEHEHCEIGECTCLERKARDSYEIELLLGPECDHEKRACENMEVRCVVDRALYQGCFDLGKRPIMAEALPRFGFPPETGDVPRVYMFCHYAR